MNKALLIIFTFIFCLFKTQKCDNIKQSINSIGTFSINSLNKIDLEKPIESKNFPDYNSELLESEFQNLFPEFLEKDCLKIVSSNSTYPSFFLCRNLYSNEKPGAYMKGQFEIIGKIKDFYLIKFKGFEFKGYFVFNVKNKTFHYFENKPFLSSNYEFIYSYSVNNHDFILNLFNTERNKEINYELNGKFKLIKIIPFEKNNFDKGLKIELNKLPIKIGNDLIDPDECKIFLEIY